MESRNNSVRFENDVDADTVCCTIGKYYRNSDFYVKDNSNFVKFFTELKKISELSTMLVDITTQCHFAAAFHNREIVPRETHQMNGEREHAYENINIDIILTHFLEHTDNTIKSLNTENANFSYLIKQLSTPKNLCAKRNGIIVPRKNVLDGVQKIVKMKQDNLKIIYLIKGKNMKKKKKYTNLFVKKN